MTVGEKIRVIRTFRGMTQKELGLSVGFDEKGADNRIAQYETDYRVPRKEMLDKIALALTVNRLNFYSAGKGDSAPEDLLRTLFWLEESGMGGITLFQLVPNQHEPTWQGERSEAADTAARYEPSDNWPLRPPVAMYFNVLVDDYMREWLVRQQEYRAGEITRKEYFEWKLNWPDTCDDLGKVTPTIKWRKNK